MILNRTIDSHNFSQRERKERKLRRILVNKTLLFIRTGTSNRREENKELKDLMWISTINQRLLIYMLLAN